VHDAGLPALSRPAGRYALRIIRPLCRPMRDRIARPEGRGDAVAIWRETSPWQVDAVLVACS
jgi:hypothetical protein